MSLKRKRAKLRKNRNSKNARRKLVLKILNQAKNVQLVNHLKLKINTFYINLIQIREKIKFKIFSHM